MISFIGNSRKFYQIFRIKEQINVLQGKKWAQGKERVELEEASASGRHVVPTAVMTPWRHRQHIKGHPECQLNLSKAAFMKTG